MRYRNPKTQFGLGLMLVWLLSVGLLLVGIACNDEEEEPTPTPTPDADADVIEEGEVGLDVVEDVPVEVEEDVRVDMPEEPDAFIDAVIDAVIDLFEDAEMPAPCTSHCDCPDNQLCNFGTGDCEDIPAGDPYTEVTFDHAAHMGHEDLSCSDCHHAAEGDRPAGNGDCATAGCHDVEWLDGVPNLKEAQHWTCRPCHDAAAEMTVECAFCHQSL